MERRTFMGGLIGAPTIAAAAQVTTPEALPQPG
jgi:hypothetical protein